MSSSPKKRKTTVKTKTKASVRQPEVVIKNTEEVLPVYESVEELVLETEVQKDFTVKKVSKKIFNSTRILTILLIIVCVVGLFMFIQSKKIGKNSSAQNEKRVREVVEKVEKIIDLPKDELPSLAVVEDTDLLSDQPFFADAQEGDIVLLYGRAQKVYIYNPKENLIVNVSGLNMGNN